ncbi:MAG: hypothetical protein LIO42_01465, partial [Oscillospiraceae bacterium]|nr:hypothetical protein [Oscillospiraceae bacterium]
PAVAKGGGIVKIPGLKADRRVAELPKIRHLSEIEETMESVAHIAALCEENGAELIVVASPVYSEIFAGGGTTKTKWSTSIPLWPRGRSFGISATGR